MTRNRLVLFPELRVFESGVLLFQAIDSAAVITVVALMSIIQMQLGVERWGPISEMENLLALVLVELCRQCIQRGNDGQLGFSILCVVVFMHWIVGLAGKNQGNEGQGR